MNIEQRIKGCLTGAAIGSELGYARAVRPDGWTVRVPSDIGRVKPDFVESSYREREHNVVFGKVASFVDVGIQAYLKKKGRVTPDDFGPLFRDSEGIAAPAFWWDPFHSVQEILKEGMNPRLSGLGATPSGLMCAAMPAVGIYHAADPEYAYLDGVEIASVAQPREGADWAGLCAAVVAAAFSARISHEDVVETALKIAYENNRALFYRLNDPVRRARSFRGRPEEEFLQWWLFDGGTGKSDNETSWIDYNPVSYILPLLSYCSEEPCDVRRFFTLLLAPSNYMRGAAATVAGALAGAWYGPEAFPAEWREPVEKTVDPWCAITRVVRARLETEKKVSAVVRTLTEIRPGKDTLLADKVYGCILAGAIGNAMGSVVENMFYQDIDARYPEHITTVLDPSRLESEDDNQAAMLITETYLGREGRPIMARHLGKTWRERFNRHHFFVHCMGHAYDLIMDGWDPRITGHWIQVTGSTVMCLEPVGIYHLADPEFAMIDAAAVSYMYQRGNDVIAAAILAAAVAEAFRPEATVESVCSAALKAAPKGKWHTFDKRKFPSIYEYFTACLEIADRYDDVFAVRKELYEKCLLYHMIDPIELLGFALAIFKVAKGDVRLCAIGGTNIGRDSDTIAGRAAMLAGILQGAGAVPAEWVALFKKESLDKIRCNAGCIAALIAGPKAERLQRRQHMGEVE